MIRNCFILADIVGPDPFLYPIVSSKYDSTIIPLFLFIFVVAIVSLLFLIIKKLTGSKIYIFIKDKNEHTNKVVNISIVILIIVITLIILLFYRYFNSYNVNEKHKIAETEFYKYQTEKLRFEAEKSFTERIMPVQNYLDECSKKFDGLNYINGETIISGASLNKTGEFYTMTFSFISPKLYNKEDIDNAVLLAKENGTYEFEGYTFYKDLDSFLNQFEDEGYKEIVNEFINAESSANSIFVTTNDKIAYFFKQLPSTNNQYALIWVGLPEGCVETEAEDTKIDIILRKNDIIKISIPDELIDNSGDDISNKRQFSWYDKFSWYAIVDYYNNCLNGTKKKIYTDSLNSNNDIYYEFDNNNIGSSAGYAGYKNAIRFEKNTIIVELPVQGGL